MTRPNEKVKPEPTQADRDNARRIRRKASIDHQHNFIPPGGCMDGCNACTFEKSVASKLAAVREEAYEQGKKDSVLSNPMYIKDESGTGIDFNATIREAHNTGAAEMVERCGSEASYFLNKYLPDDGHPNHATIKKIILSVILRLSPDPNWLQGKIEESTKELREALVVYGRHRENCDFLNILPSKPCKCGFDKTRQALSVFD